MKVMLRHWSTILLKRLWSTPNASYRLSMKEAVGSYGHGRQGPMTGPRCTVTRNGKAGNTQALRLTRLTGLTDALTMMCIVLRASVMQSNQPGFGRHRDPSEWPDHFDATGKPELIALSQPYLRHTQGAQHRLIPETGSGVRCVVQKVPSQS